MTTPSLGYPDRTFETRILPSDPSINISSSAPSEHSSIPTEPLQHAVPHFDSEVTLASLQRAAQHLREGQVVAFPTETVYGLGANALDEHAVRKIYAAKHRPADNPLIVHVSDRTMLNSILPPDYTPSPAYEVLMRAFWPGALTLLFPVAGAQPSSSNHGSSSTSTSVIPSVVTCGQPSVAVRLPSHPLARALIALTDRPLAAPSANASGRPSPTTAAHVMRDMGGSMDNVSADGKRGGRLAFILDGGACDVGVESTVVDGISTPGELRVLRPGGVTVEQLAQVLRGAGLLRDEKGAAQESTSKPGAVQLRVYGKDLARSAAAEAAPTTPGMKYRHYSPDARVVLLVPVSSSSSSSSSSASVSLPSGSNTDVPAAFSDLASGPVYELGQALASQLDAVMHAPGRHHLRTTKATRKIGLMSISDSPLTRALVPSTSEARETRSWLEAQDEKSLARHEVSTHELLAPPCTLPPAFLSPAPLPPSASSSNGTAAPAPTPSATPSSSTPAFPQTELHPFTLGPARAPHLSAQRLFDGLRTLDEGPLRALSDSVASPSHGGQTNNVAAGGAGGEGDEPSIATRNGSGSGSGSGSSADAGAGANAGASASTGCDLILVEAIPDTGVGLAVMNRLAKAASATIRVRV